MVEERSAAEAAEKIGKEELLEEIRAALEEFFLASVSKRGGSLFLHFSNGQKFSLEIGEA